LGEAGGKEETDNALPTGLLVMKDFIAKSWVKGKGIGVKKGDCGSSTQVDPNWRATEGKNKSPHGEFHFWTRIAAEESRRINA